MRLSGKLVRLAAGPALLGRECSRARWISNSSQSSSSASSAATSSPRSPSSRPPPRQKQAIQHRHLDNAELFIRRMRRSLKPQSPDQDRFFVSVWGRLPQGRRSGRREKQDAADADRAAAVEDGSEVGGDEGEGEEVHAVAVKSYLARCGVCSQAQVSNIFDSSTVTLNGLPCLSSMDRMKPSDVLRIDGEVVLLPPPMLWLYHKPAAQLDQAPGSYWKEQEVANTLSQLRELGVPHAVPVGGLGMMSEGLQLLTNDSMLAQYLGSPSSGVKRVFIVQVQGIVPTHLLDSVTRGAFIDGRQYSGLPLETLRESRSCTQFKLTFTSDKRQRDIRPMLKSIHCNIQFIKRVQFGPYFLKGLSKGDIRVPEMPEAWLQQCNQMWRPYAAKQWSRGGRTLALSMMRKE
eukprot:NODE_1773_length_1412_cov_25.465150_g1602_i0.p1 GENE.NODE_1773_length_1412_cov_25.465150_g1602_i0~~NODE_1773_length_1412_cov_25.465150_g1602_i0.p1  ORF type:complete len:404 (+),score=73.08 NODE_1773_length_1412_cov_25.465150_g1602_i0:61-1272(+)